MLYGGNTSCIQINSPAVPELIILDAGTGIRNLGNELCVTSCAHRGNIFITHPHWDHVQGFPFLNHFLKKGIVSPFLCPNNWRADAKK